MPSLTRLESKEVNIKGWPVFLVFAVLATIYLLRSHQPRLLLILLLLHIIVVIIHLIPFVAIGTWRRAAIEEIGLFLGPALFRTRLGSWPLRINALPIGGYVRFKRLDEQPPPGWLPTNRSASGRAYQDMFLWEKLLLNICPIPFLLLVSASILGPQTAWMSFIHGFRQIFEGVIDAKQIGIPLLSGFLSIIAQHRFITAFAILATKEVAANALPLPTANGGAALLELIQWIMRRPLPNQAQVISQLVALLVMMVLVVAWLFVLFKAAQSLAT